ncbi:diguanylate cyclase [Nanoarchaeota archaeon]
MPKELKDLIDIQMWKKMQDAFARSIKLPTVTINKEGNILLLSNDFPYFCQLVQSTEEGKRQCQECRRKNYEKLKEEKGRIQFFYCHAELLCAIVPIFINEQQVGAVICESILNTKKIVPKCRIAAESTGIETVELIDAINLMRIQPRESIEMYGTLLYIMSNTIPELVHYKKASQDKINELEILNKISTMVSSTLELDKMLERIMDYMVSTVIARSASIIIIEENQQKRFSFKEDKESEFYKTFEQALLTEILKTDKRIVIPNIGHDPRFTDENDEEDISIIAIPLRIKNKVAGVINLYGAPIKKLSDYSLDFLNVMTNQAALAIQNAQQYEQIKELAITDKLTGLYNRRHFETLFETEVERSKRYQHPLSVALLDIDNFGHYNNTHGHPKGDVLLESFSLILKNNTRKIDILGRYGGEEFIIVMPNTNKDESYVIAERIRKSIEDFEFHGREKQPLGKVTASIGVVTNFDYSHSREDLVEISDEALYKAKNGGRNKVVQTIKDGPKPEDIKDQNFDEFVYDKE